MNSWAKKKKHNAGNGGIAAQSDRREQRPCTSMRSRTEIDSSRSGCSEEGRDYLSLKFDDPSFNAPIYANLFDDEGEEIIPSRVAAARTG
jgi:uncharacterized protein (DUF736 family)